MHSRSGAHLSALALETTDALLSPLSSHLRRWFETVIISVNASSQSGWPFRGEGGDSHFCEDEEMVGRKTNVSDPRRICVVGG